MKVLAGDIGGTKIILQIVEVENEKCNVIWEKEYYSTEYIDFLPIIRDFYNSIPAELPADIASACIGIAGPISSDKQSAQVTNLPWYIKAEDLIKELNINKLKLINDFQAIAYGVIGLDDSELEVLQTGSPQIHGHRSIIGAGTGLGFSQLLWQSGNNFEVLTSEGGHADFAPCDREQIDLLIYLREKYPNVSWEHVVSGPGLVEIYSFLCDASTLKEKEDNNLIRTTPLTDAEQISNYANNQDDPLARRAMDIFIKAYGAQAGNFALTTLPFGGLYIAGGIAPKILNNSNSEIFVNAFTNKSKMSSLLIQVPVYLVRNPKVGLIGASLIAARL